MPLPPTPPGAPAREPKVASRSAPLIFKAAIFRTLEIHLSVAAPDALLQFFAHHYFARARVKPGKRQRRLCGQADHRPSRLCSRTAKSKSTSPKRARPESIGETSPRSCLWGRKSRSQPAESSRQKARHADAANPISETNPSFALARPRRITSPVLPPRGDYRLYKSRLLLDCLKLH